MVDWFAGKRVRGTSSERTGFGLSLGGTGVGGWVELGRTTLSGTADSIDVTSLPDKRYYMYLYHLIPSGVITDKMRFNSDSGTNYAQRLSHNGVTDSTSTSRTDIQTGQSSSSLNKFGVGYIANYTNKEKLLTGHGMDNGASGASTAPNRGENVGKWANTSNSISTISQVNTTAGDYASGSEVVVLGYDPADTHTNNFWTELASVQLGSAGDTIDSGTFTAKKYLWFQYFNKASGSAGVNIQFNGDTGSNYARREGKNGTADSTVVNQTDIEVRALYGNAFGNFFVINNQSNEKLVLGHEVNQNTAGAGTAPQRNEIAGKWANTSNQITSIQLINDGGGDFDTGSIIKVWGAD